MLEKEFQKKVVSRLRKEGAIVQKLSDMFSIGIPDLLVGWEGRVCFVEIKMARDSGKLKSPLTGAQKAWADKWGAHVRVRLLVGFDDGSWVLDLLSDRQGLGDLTPSTLMR